jgi:UDP-N-acetylmuramate dehydrogenase
MKVTQHASLQALNTFGVAARASLLIEVECEEDVLNLPVFDPARDFILGGGSNVLFVDDVPGTVFLNRIRGIAIVEENAREALLEVGAGEDWHGLVSWSLHKAMYGLENLALIPGLTGAAPVQNIGAYGVELASMLESVTAWDWHSASWQVLSREQCLLGYRDSVFKSAQAGRFLITSLRLRLSKNFAARLEYSGLRQELSSAGITKPDAWDVYAAVVRLRRRKLPDPAESGNAGSFFKNPLISREQLELLRRHHPGLPACDADRQRVKIPAAWMIEQCGLKGRRHGGAAVSSRHALVLINQDQASGADLWELAQQVQRIVHERFAVMLEPEPRVYLQAESPPAS